MPCQLPQPRRARLMTRRLAPFALMALALGWGPGQLPAGAEEGRAPATGQAAAATPAETAAAPQAETAAASVAPAESPSEAPAAAPAESPAEVPSQAADQEPGATPAATEVAPVVQSRILLALGRREIRLERDGKIYGPWPVAIGDPRTPTPTGTFAVKNKVVNPQYASTRTGKVNPKVGPNGPLGDRWIGFKTQGLNQFGIHGTPWPTWVDQRAAVTNGCVRMKHEHVRKLFELVDLGTAVVITN